MRDLGGAGEGHDALEARQPGKHDLGGRRAYSVASAASSGILCEPGRAFATEGSPREQPDAVVATVLGDAIPQVVIVERRKAHLHRVDVDDASRGLHLPYGDVAQADASHATGRAQGGQGADTRLERHARIDGVQLVEVDRVDAEVPATGLARLSQVPRLAVRHPGPARPGQAPLGRNLDARSIAGPVCERRGHESLVVPDLAVVARVRVGGVEQRDTGVERRGDDGDGIARRRGQRRC